MPDYLILEDCRKQITPTIVPLGFSKPFSSISKLLGYKAILQGIRCFESQMYNNEWCIIQKTQWGLGDFLRLLDYEDDHNLDELSLSRCYHFSSPITWYWIVAATFAQVWIMHSSYLEQMELWGGTSLFWFLKKLL